MNEEVEKLQQLIKSFGETIGLMLVTRAFNEVDGNDNTVIDNDIERLKKQMVKMAKIYRRTVEKDTIVND